jgi:hypothetical protein
MISFLLALLFAASYYAPGARRVQRTLPSTAGPAVATNLAAASIMRTVLSGPQVTRVPPA